MEPIKNLNGQDLSPYDPSLPNEGTGVESREQITDMSRKAPNGVDTDELSVVLRKMTGQMEQSSQVFAGLLGTIERQEQRDKSPMNSRNGTFALGLIGAILGVGMFVGGMQVRSSTTAGDHDELITLRTQVVDWQKNMEQSLKDIKDEIVKQGALRAYEAGVKDAQAKRR